MPLAAARPAWARSDKLEQLERPDRLPLVAAPLAAARARRRTAQILVVQARCQ
jgi:hypothetical protein